MESIGQVFKRNELKGSITKRIESNYSCKLCKDTGWVYELINNKPDYSSVVRCECRKEFDKQNRYEALLKLCEFPANSEHMVFSQYKVNGLNKSAYDLARKLAKGDNDICWLSLLGESDLGKTHLAIAICREWIKRLIPAKYAYVPILLDDLKDGYQDEDYNRRVEFYRNVPLLALDDLGVEKGTEWAREQLDTLVDYRSIRALPTIITTNKSLDELPDRIASRMIRTQNAKVVNISGKGYHA